MDKLKPILAQKFWIFFALTLILPAYGWWSASASLQEQFNSRKTSLTNLFGQIPPGVGTPNQKWIDGVNQLNAKREEANTLSHQRLWDRQLTLLKWPDTISSVMAKSPYRSEIVSGDDMDMARSVPDLYRGDYESELFRIWTIVDPLEHAAGAQKLELKYDKIPRVPESRWENNPPNWEEMWNAQEDIWLLTEIFEAVNEVNDSFKTRADSAIKRIQRIDLAGGDRAAYESGSGGGGGKPASGGALQSVIGAGGASNPAAEGDFQLSDVFGKPQAAAAAPAQAAPPGGKPPAAAADKGKVEPTESRYVDNTPKFRTRAFLLKVDMDHRRLPHLLAALTNSQWPVEIVRVHQIARSENVTSTEDEEESTTASEISPSALTGPNMSTVVIAGLFTLFNPPPVTAAAADQQPSPDAGPAATPADPAAVPAGANPAATDPAAPAAVPPGAP